MIKHTLYRLDSAKKVREWSIQVQENADGTATLTTVAGIKDGKMQEAVTPITISDVKSQDTPYNQAIFDMETELRLKMRKGYGYDLNNLKGKGETETIKDPMKGHSYHPTNPKLGKNLDKMKLRGVYAGIQRKLDGWRYRIHVTRDEIIYYTSSGKVTLEFPQVSESIRRTFDKNIDYWFGKYGVEEYYLDGEIYNHDLGFQLSASACACGGNKTEQDELNDYQRDLRNQMQFWLFDVCLDAPYETREKVIAYFYDEPVIKKVDTHKVILTEKVIEDYMNQFLSEGFEGVIIRTLYEGYQYKKCSQLTKYKPVIDDEFPIVGFEESIQKNTLGAIIIALPDGRHQRANLKEDLGTDKMRKEIWDNQAAYLGKWVTVEFLEHTDDGLLRLPRAKAFRKGKSQD